jgi:hypothetical protein
LPEIQNKKTPNADKIIIENETNMPVIIISSVAAQKENELERSGNPRSENQCSK